MLSCSDVEAPPESGVWAAEDTGAKTTPSTIEPRLAMSGDGRACLVWIEDGESDQLMATRFYPNSGWSSPELLAEAGWIHGADVVMADQGELLVVWTRSGEDGSLSFYRRFAADGWAAEELIDAEAAGCDECATSALDVALDRDGNGLALYAFVDGPTAAWRASQYRPDAGWTQLAETEIVPSDLYSRAVRGSTDAAVAWVIDTHNPVGGDLWLSRFSVDSGWAAPEEIASDQPDLWAPSVVLDGSGGTFVAFARENNLHVIRRELGAAWSEPQLLDEAVGAYADWPFYAKADDAGNAHFLWEQGYGHLGVASFTLESGWVAGPEIDTVGRGARWPTLAVAPDGRALAAWEQQDNERGDSSVQARRYTPANGWEEPLPVDPGPGSQFYKDPRVAIGDGRAMVIWNADKPVASGASKRSFRWSTSVFE